MQLTFEKFHGAGNDFILIDDRLKTFPANHDLIAQLCNRHLGIGADGLILIQPGAASDFDMIYFNADGNPGTLCGNGGRCAVIFAHKLGLIRQSARFKTSDGIHDATITDTNSVKLSMNGVNSVQKIGHDYVMDTGSPHYVLFCSDLSLDVLSAGRKIRNSESYQEHGINVNFVWYRPDGIRMRTYERGVEDETLSCGTGTVAAAIATSVMLNRMETDQLYDVHALGGHLKVSFKREGPQQFSNVFLEGPVEHVFSGAMEI